MLFTHERAQALLGQLGSIVAIMMFAGPLQSVKTVLLEESVASLPLPTAVACTLNCLLWTCYGVMIKNDVYVYGPNGAGLLCGLIQLSLFARFGFAKEKQDNSSSSSCSVNLVQDLNNERRELV